MKVATFADGLLLSVIFSEKTLLGASMKVRGWVGSCVLVLALALSAAGQSYNEAQFKGLKWRDIGPFRGGRVLAVTGVSGSPFTYYFGSVAGGVWRTTDGGVSWQPISDKTMISSIGASSSASRLTKDVLAPFSSSRRTR